MSYSGGPLPKGVTLENLHLFLPHTRGTVGHSPITPANPEAVMVITDSAGPPKQAAAGKFRCSYCGTVRATDVGLCPQCAGNKVHAINTFTQVKRVHDPRKCRGTSSGGPR